MSRSSHVMPLLVSALLLPLLFVVTDGQSAEPDPFRDSRLFRLDKAGKKIKGTAGHVPNYLGLKLASVTVDQPQYWPNEKVFLKVLMPGRGKTALDIKRSKRDATPVDVPNITLDEAGAAVVPLMDGTETPLQLGEYRVDVKTADGKLQGSTTFAVVEGSLGAMSLAFEFKQVTSPSELDNVKGGWFLGNAAGAGTRWGNGLSFKNELRVDNQPYEGEVQLISRCMLSGCNGIPAGPGKTVMAVKGQVSGTMDVGGHSGPFQIEFVTPYGSLRHQFEGSSHVERDMILISRGVRFTHRAGLAPYSGTTQVPGRQIFVERQAAPDDRDAFEVESAIAKDGRIDVKVREALSGAKAYVWAPKADGSFESREVSVRGKLGKGEVVSVDVPAPFGLVTIGGFHDGTLAEGFLVAFPPASITIGVKAPPQSEPLSTIPVTVSVKDKDGKGVATSGILEAFDNRVASKSPAQPLGSAVGDAIRNVGNSLNAWVDPLEVERQRVLEDKRAKEEEKRERERDKVMSRKSKKAPHELDLAYDSAPSPKAYGTGSGGGSYGYATKSAPSKGYAMKRPAMSPSPTPGHAHAGGDDEGGEGEVIRRGEKKVVFVGLVKTGADGTATVDVEMPPQTGRLSFRFVALGGLDWAWGEGQGDVTRDAWADIKAPRGFVPGARLDLRVVAENKSRETLELRASGEGIQGVFASPVGPGRHELTVPWQGEATGKLRVALVDKHGKTKDKRELDVASVATQGVTWTRLEFGGKRAVPVDVGDRVVVFQGPGQLLKGTVMNMVTTMYSWFPHAEALSAQVAVRATILAAISRGVIDDEGLERTLRVDLDKAVRDLHKSFWDPGSSMMKPYPNLEPNTLWTMWSARNLHAALRMLKAEPKAGAKLKQAIAAMTQMTTQIDAAQKARGGKVLEVGGYDPDQGGEDVIPIEIDGKVVWRVVTDDSVQKFAIEKLGPLVDVDTQDQDKAFAKAYDRFRFLRAFERTGRLQYMMHAAKAAWLAGPKGRDEFDRLFGVIARGMIFTQEPGMLQGPATLGGVYSTPMALVRFLDLLLMTTSRKAEATLPAMAGRGGAKLIAFGQAVDVKERGAVQAPSGAVVRVDRKGKVSLTDGALPPYANVKVSALELAMGADAWLTLELDASKDPLEYYAIIAVPTTVAIKQTEDILSDYKGQLIYGQQGAGASKMQLIAVPFRGKRTMKLLLEGAFPGASTGLIAIRHLQRPELGCALKIPEIRVRGPGAPSGGAVVAPE